MEVSAEWLSFNGVKQEGEFTELDAYQLLAKSVLVNMTLERVIERLELLGADLEFKPNGRVEIIGDWSQFKYVYFEIYELEHNMEFVRKGL